MALDKGALADTKPCSTSSPPPADLESDIAELATLLTQSQDDPPEDNDNMQVAELMKRLTAADGAAKGVEERLDGLIENLDMLLAALEQDHANGHPSEAGTLDKADDKQPSG
ncbi:hypothetical protein P691DRAFT_804714 [Macrolepiota fuliginosa MF-IS2]|uniref:Uncharacterized protein n=1 Tax=Macrolepiota fuliginosa MF-IS2 TaxID=1400762 RepID=A0A9P5X7P9_9AGAR|nr:hypothetical protein P691DRAFT_804714 [Macrolepiota fuliginosa MF-IS2]